MINQKAFRQTEDPKHPLHHLLLPVKAPVTKMVIKPSYPYQLPLSKTSHYDRDFIPYCMSEKLGLSITVF